MTKIRNVLSLCDGISCGQIALNKANIEYENYFASEIDKRAIKVTQTNYPNTIQLGDIINWENWNIDWNSIDLVLSGTPCQGFSIAGKQDGFKDNRSSLFLIFVDILNFIKTKNNKVKFLFENVPMKQEYQNIITSKLNTNPIKLDSSLFSAQRRPRLYWTNMSINILSLLDKGILFKDILDKNCPQKYNLSLTLTSRYHKFYEDNGYKLIIGSTAIEGKIGQRDRVYGINNKIPTLTATDYKQPKQVLVNGVLRKVSPLECERLQTLPDNYTSCLSDTQRYKVIGDGWTVEVITFILNNIYQTFDK